jgi:hypothetical protein
MESHLDSQGNDPSSQDLRTTFTISSQSSRRKLPSKTIPSSNEACLRKRELAAKNQQYTVVPSEHHESYGSRVGVAFPWPAEPKMAMSIT